ncbi:MAG TPA: POTRA domain-containing protein, partial [Pyrinomonadaceae bacterium]|nr:POTRA domain-containing protein [Pyrinomonadaceae bacterium]
MDITRREIANFVERLNRFSIYLLRVIMSLCLCGLIFVSGARAQNNFENRAIADIYISFLGDDRDPSAAEQFKLIAQSILIGDYSAIKIRETLQALYNTEKIVSAQVEATPVGENQVNLRFIIKRKTQAERVSLRVGDFVGDEISEDQLLLRVNILNQGGAVTEQTLRSNADSIQSYLRDRGYYNADVTFTQTPLGTANRVAV